MNTLESLLRKAGRELADYQVARFFKIPEELTQTPCDFFGYTASGRAILIEAKMVTRPRLPIGTSNGLQPHQWNELCDAHRAGAIALIAWKLGNEVAVIDPAMAIEISKGSRSIPWVGIPHQFIRPFQGRGAHLRWLEHWLPLPPTEPPAPRAASIAL